jgi:2-polyprenyl-6-methoxyphenol hydroxylase-like FAD-dependent oxidoreductase
MSSSSAGRSRIVIAGGGIGGLTLAHALREADVDVVICEMRPVADFYRRGFWLEINEEGVRALRRSLSPQAFESFTSVSQPAFDQNVRWMPRSVLQHILLHTLGDGRPVFDQEVTDFRLSGSEVEVFLANGQSLSCSLLVGADGARSRVRAKLLPDARLEDTDILVVGGSLPLNDASSRLIPPLAHEHPIALTGPEQEQVLVAVWHARPTAIVAGSAWSEQSHVMWRYSAKRSKYPSQNQIDTVSVPILLKEASSLSQRWIPQFGNLIRLTDLRTIFALPLRSSLPVAPWQTSRVTLLGDAIHSMVPHGGFGANIALKDASLLGAAVTSAIEQSRDVVDALSSYEANMRDYGFNAVRRAMELLRSTYGTDIGTKVPSV